ncbi:MAG: hypothetical protein GEU88_16965 [Solirubrobacterales bacterium]|nr:hypothetical protein [Solirubrobacterales bacterium]
MQAPSARELIPLLLAAAFPLVALIHEGGLLAALPLLLLAVPLLLGRYPGERTLELLRARRDRPERPARSIAPAPSPPRRQPLLRNRLLIAASLAERAPPAAALS